MAKPAPNARPAAKPKTAPKARAAGARPKKLAPAEQARIAELFERFEAQESDPRTELDYDSPYTLVVAVALSAQATDVSVNKATARLFAVADTPQQMLALGEEGLKPYISSIGLFNTKAKNVIALSRILIEQYGGEVPLEREKLQALPGVGRKTASVVLNELRIEPAIAVDTHVFRVSHRLGLATGKTPDQVEAQLMAVVPEPYLTRAHHWLILHGRYVCTARRPKCEECPVADLCPSRHLFTAGR
jgi:endonuclease-3